MVKNCLILATIFFITALFASCDFGTTSRYYQLGVVNSGATPVELKVSLADGSWTIGPGEAKTIKIEHQKDSEVKTERVFTLTSNGETKTVKGNLRNYSGYVVLDVTGTSCLVAADYGPQYRDKDTKLPEGTSDIKLLKKFKGSQFFIPETWDAEKATFDFVIQTGLGEKLPERLQRGKTGPTIPTYVRLINVPCEITEDSQALYKYLNNN